VSWLLLVALFSFREPSGPDAAKAAVSKFESRYRSAKTLSATFLEQYKENGRLVRAESGTGYFRKPGRMRWEYESPENSLFLVDGKTTWFYVPSDHTATKVPAKESQDWRTPLALLAGEVKVAKVCASVSLAPMPGNAELGPNTVNLKCILRGPDWDNQSPQIAFFRINRETGELEGISVNDPGGITVEFQFANWIFDPPLPEAMFHFEPPRGVAIVNGELGSQAPPR